MPFSTLITLTNPGISTGLFELRTNTNSYATTFETDITRQQLVDGYTSNQVPDGTTIIRVKSTGACTNEIDLTISNLPTPTTSTTTTTPPAPVSPLEFSSEFDNVIGEDGVDTGTSVQWNYSGTITIATGYTYTFKTYAGNYGDPNGTVSSSATIDGTTMNAYNPFGDGTVLSTNSKTLTAGTYNYSLAITISSIGDLGGGISWT